MLWFQTFSLRHESVFCYVLNYRAAIVGMGRCFLGSCVRVCVCCSLYMLLFQGMFFFVGETTVVKCWVDVLSLFFVFCFVAPLVELLAAVLAPTHF